MTSNEQIYDRLGSIDQKLGDVVVQTTKTNGRVTALEKWKGEVEIASAEKQGEVKGEKNIEDKWTARKVALIGFLAFLLGSIIVPIVTTYFK